MKSFSSNVTPCSTPKDLGTAEKPSPENPGAAIVAVLAISLVSEIGLTTKASDDAFPKPANAEPDAEDAVKDVGAKPDAIGADNDVVAKPDAEEAFNDVGAKPYAEGTCNEVGAKPDPELKFKEVGTGREVVGLAGEVC